VVPVPSRLARRVGRLSAVAGYAADRRDVDDPPAGADELALEQRLVDPLLCRQVDGEDGVPVFPRHPPQRLVAGDPRVVDDGVEAYAPVAEVVAEALGGAAIGAVRPQRPRADAVRRGAPDLA